MASQTLEDAGQEELISASDIERYGYCPLNWWLKREGVKEVGPGLKKGTEKHIEIAEDLDDIRKEEDTLQISEFNIKVFGIIAAILAINGVMLITPIELIGNFFIFTAILWLVVAVIYFEIALKKEKRLRNKTKSAPELEAEARKNKREKPEKPAQEPQKASKQIEDRDASADWKRSAIWFILIACVLALNGSTIIFQVETEILSRIIVISALLWLMGTSVILFIVLRSEARKPDFEEPKTFKLRLKRKLTESEKLVIGFAIVATVLAINGLTIKHRDYIMGLNTLGQILLILAVIWLGASFLFLYFAFKGGVISRWIAQEFKSITLKDIKPEKRDVIQSEIDKMVGKKLPEPERGALWFAVVALVLGINSILITLAPLKLLAHILGVISLIWLLGASIFLYNALRGSEIAVKLRELHGFEKGKIYYTDKIDDSADLLVAKSCNISGRPDSIITLEDKYFPIEIKTGRVPKGPYFSHILQVAAYCLLVEETNNVTPPYGIIKYSKDTEFKIDYTPELKTLLLEKVNDMRKVIESKNVHRNHHREGKCRFCSRRKKCPERLDQDEKDKQKRAKQNS